MCILSFKSKINRILDQCRKKKSAKRQGRNGAPQPPTTSTYGYGLVHPYRLGDGDWWKYIDDNGVCSWPKHGIIDLKHHLLKHLWLINFTAPVDEELKAGANVLNLGCGKGSWIMDMATQYSASNFIGIDMCIPEELIAVKPENVHLRHFDVVRNGIPYPDEAFDYVHVRMTCTSFAIKDHKKIMKELLRVTKSGGFIELVEANFRWCINDGSNFSRLMDGYQRMLQSKRINPDPITNIDKILTDTGQVVDITVETRNLKIGRWGSAAGELASQAIKGDFESYKETLPAFMGITPDEYDDLVKLVINDFDKSQISMQTCCAFGTKMKPTRRMSIRKH